MCTCIDLCVLHSSSGDRKGMASTHAIPEIFLSALEVAAAVLPLSQDPVVQRQVGRSVLVARTSVVDPCSLVFADNATSYTTRASVYVLRSQGRLFQERFRGLRQLFHHVSR